MQQKTLHQRKRKYFLLILLLSVAGMTKMYAQDFGRISRDATMQPVQQKKADYDSGFATIQETNSSPRTIRSDGELDYTTYDWQTNAGAITRTIVWPDGKVNFAFTQAFNSSFTDRGTAIGTYDVMNDEWIPSEGRVENQKTGFGSIARYGENGIVLAAHTSTQCAAVYIIQNKDNIESNSTQMISYLDSTYNPMWPNVMTSGNNRNIIHVVATAYDHASIPGMENVNQPILYFRSQDGGQTWDRQNVILPFMDASYCLDWGSNVCYWMETTENNCLALVVNNAWSDGMVIYSYDNGETWQRKVFYKHPNPFGTFDDIFLYPRWTSCQWDSQQHLHVLYEFNGCTGVPGSDTYYPSRGGVAYWNETMPYNENGTTQSAVPGNLIPGQPFILDNDYLNNDVYASLWCFSDASHQMWPEYIGYLPPLDDYGNWENPYTTNSFNIANFSLHGSYNSGVCGFPVLCRVPDTDDDMVALWCAMDENHMDSNGNYYYKIFASYSGDGGVHWTNMVHLTNNFYFQDKECVYLQAAVVNNKIVIACQMDGITGTFVQNDDSNPYDNYYQGLTFDLEVLFGNPSYFTYISVTANPSCGGTIIGGGMYQQGQTCMLTAIANDGYTFVNWTKDGVEVSIDTIYSFIVTETDEYIANFSSLPYEITAVSNPTEGGTITGYGIYNYGQSCTLTAVANEGYTFMYWTENGNIVSTDASYSFTVTGNRTLVANFVEGNACTITFNLYDSWGDGWSGNKLVVTYDDGSNDEITLENGSYGTQTLWFVNESHITLTWIVGSYMSECSFTLSYSNGNVIYHGSNLNSSFSYEFGVDCEGMPAISFDITAVAYPEEGGSVIGTGEYDYGTTCTLTATPNEGYTFMYWTESVNGFLYEVSSNATYSFTVTENRNLVARFALPFSITATADPTDGGMVTGGGEYDYGTTCTLTAIPNEGYCFYYWTVDNYIASYDTIFSFIVTSDREYVGVFGLPLSISAEAYPEEGGSVIGGGVFNYGSTCTLTATANEGYTFMYWTENGQQVSTDSTYSFTVTQRRSLVAHFALPFSITATAYLADGGVVTGAGEYDYGSICTLTATPNENYLFLNWSRNGEVVSCNGTYSFTVTEDIDLEAIFMLLEGVLIGESEATNYYLPSYSYYCYTLSQQIYTADEIGGAGSITSISYFNAGGTKTRSYDIYLVHTDKSSFENINDWIAVSEADRVYSGNVTMTKGYWTTIELSTPFIYDGTSNLVIIVDDNTGSYTGSPHMACRVFYTEDNQAIRIYNDSPNHNPYNPTQYNGTLHMEKNQIILGFLDPDYRFISVSTNPHGVGTIDGGGYYQLGDTCTLTATASNVYEFVNWTKDGIIVSDNPTYSFIVTENASYSANFLWINPASTDYVSDGLIMYLDGIYNTRSGHSTTTNVWEDLIGNYDLTVNNYSSYAWKDNHFLGLGNGGYLNTGKTWQYFNSLNDDLTIEIVTYIDCDKTFPSYRGLAGWHEWSDGTNFQNDQGSSIMQTLGQLPVTEADDQIATVSYTRNNGSFLDGVWKTDASNLPNGVSSSKIVVFGNSLPYSRGWNDSIYCIRMYNRSLTPEEIAHNHNIDVERFIEGIYTIDTTLYAEICQGEDYLDNGFEIYYPEVGENQNSITLPSSQGIDSIVNLTLTVHPVYFFAEDTTLCNATSYTWRGNTYTESGIYYDSLQTIHGCDSIFQLSLELFNTPLGEFASMTPTNNYPFTSLPITFSWDAVSGAEYYNLYLWNTDDSVPSTPFAGNIYNRSCYVSSLQNHQTYNWYVEAVNTCFSSTSSVRSFSLNIPPSMNVSTNSLAFGEVVLNDSVSMNMFVSGNSLDDAITLQITGEDASMFSFEQGSNWNGLTGGSLTVTFSPTAVQYNYTANLVITTGTLTQTVQLTGSLADMFVFNTYVTQDVFEMNSTIPIYGTVTDVNNSPMAGAEVEVKVKVMGTTRSLFATTGDDGHFSVDFVPAYSESGYYTVNSGRVGHNSTAVHDDFNIPGMNLVTNGWILWDVVQNETTTGSIVIRNRSQIPLTNIQVAATTLPEGCSFTFQPLSLQGMEEGVLEYSVTGSALTSGNNYEEVRLVATSAEGATMNFSAWYYCAEPRGILYAAPNNITTTMTKGNSKIVDVMLYNNGTGPTGNVYLDLPSVDWLSVVGNDTLPSIAVHDSAYFSLRLSANENTSLVQYTGNIAINCERGDGLSLPYTITAVSDSTGTLVVDVTDDYTYNGNGEHLAGATVTLKGYYSLQTVAIGLTGSDGTFTVEDVPEGYYRMSITAPRHAEYQATIQIEGGQTNTQNIYLQYQAITYSWNVVPTEIEDEYTFELIVEYETNVPVPVVVIDMPQTFPELEEGESYVFNYIITNYGLVDTYDATLYPPTGHPLYDFTPLITEIDTLHAQSSVVIPCTMTRRTRQRSQAVWEALGRGGNREETECPYSALTQTKQYYICGDQENWFWANAWRNIGGYACESVPYTPTPGAPVGGGGGGYGGGGGGSSSSTPQITVQNNDCDFDPCLSGTKDDIDNCDNNGTPPPNLPPQNPANNK